MEKEIQLILLQKGPLTALQIQSALEDNGRDFNLNYLTNQLYLLANEKHKRRDYNDTMIAVINPSEIFTNWIYRAA